MSRGKLSMPLAIERAVHRSTARRRRIRLQPFRIDIWFRKLHYVFQFTVDPEFHRKLVEIVIEAQSSGVSSQMLHGFGDPSGSILSDRGTIECDPEVISHGLHTLVIFAAEPRQNRIAWKIVDPAFERLGQLDS